MQSKFGTMLNKSLFHTKRDTNKRHEAASGIVASKVFTCIEAQISDHSSSFFNKGEDDGESVWQERDEQRPTVRRLCVDESTLQS